MSDEKFSRSVNEKETDLLKYESNKVPLVLVLVWIVLIVFVFVYLARYSFPDLGVWLEKLKNTP